MASLSGPNSRRRLGTVSGDMRREARRLNRSGNERAAGALMLAAAEQRMTEGSAISNSQGRKALEQKQQALERGLMESRRRALVGANTATPPAATPAPTPAATSPTRTATPAPAPAPAPASSGVPILGGALDAARTLPREGRINGMPASQAIDEAKRSAQRPQFGGDIARRNLATGGLSAALADYQRRSAEYDAQQAAPPTPEEPGNLAELRARDFVGPPASAAPGPLTRSLAQATTERETLAAQPTVPAPLPLQSRMGPPARRELAGPPAPVPVAGPPAPSPTLRRPVSPQIKSAATTPNIGSDSFVSLEAPLTDARRKFREEEAKGLKAPLRSATLAVGSGLSRLGRDIRKSYK